MYEVSVESSFNATHRVRMPDGNFEPLHGHDWRVRATFCREELDAAGMVVDFIAARNALEAVVHPLGHSDLNECPLLCGANPTAELVARAIFDALASDAVIGQVLDRVSVIEAPGCQALYCRPRVGLA